MTSVIEIIANWCAAMPEPGEKARALARNAITDTIACMYAGRHDMSVRAVARAFGGEGAIYGHARLVTGGRQAAALAAMVNGTAAHALDYDDNFKPGMSHASAVIVPALLAVADHAGATGKAFLDAYLIALQAQAFVGNGVGPSHYTAGWHGTSTVGSIGTAAGTAALLGLDRAGIARALSLGASMASGTKGQFGTSAKPFHAGMAARNAVEAAFLAAEGLQGRLDILEGEQGFLEMFGGVNPKHYVTEDIAATSAHVIETVGVMPKRHPCCGSTHLAVDMALDIMLETPFNPDEIATAECHVGIANFRNLAYPVPVNEMEARFSMQYCLAKAFRQGKLSLSDFTQDAVATSADPLRRKISMTHYSSEEERAAEILPHILKITLANGRVFERRRFSARGGIADPFSDADRQQKFFDCCADADNASSIYQAFQRLEEADDLAFLAPLF